MNKKKKYTQNFSEFDSADTENFPPPEYLVKPAKGDKGFTLTKASFNKMSKHFSPGMSGAGLNLPDKG